LPVEDLGGAACVYQLWADLEKHAKNLTAPSDADILEAATGSMRAILEKIKGLDWKASGDAKGSHASEEDLRILFEIYNTTSNSTARINVVRIMASLSVKLSKTLPAPNTVMQEVGTFLLHVANTDTEIVMRAECLDALMDVFADDDLHSVTREIDMVSKLKTLLPSFKEMINATKKKRDWQSPFVKDVKNNIVRFIHYKQEYQRKQGKQPNK
jgi:hypothetical protein